MRGLTAAVRARELVEHLGDPLSPSGPLTFAQAVADDQRAAYPYESVASLHRWGYTAYQVPAAFGGRLTSLPELVALGRVVASRDPAVAVVANAPLAAAMPVWIAGTPAQRHAVAEAVLDGEAIALGLTEREHGADVLASEVTARRTDDGYVLNGTKWLINNIRRARYVCLLAREPDRHGMRSLTLLLVDLDTLVTSSYDLLPKIATHGIRGAEIAGIRFRDAVVPETACIGRPGRGLELTARSLLVTRTLVPGLSLGGLDTALRCRVDFLRSRRLDGGRATALPWVQDELAAAFLDLSVADVVLDACVRSLHLLPAVAPVASAVAKYLVPHLATARMRGLGTTLGASYYLREGHWSGIFEKLLRDVRLFGLFDGSEPVVLSALAAQASCLTRPDTDPREADRLFAPDGWDDAGLDLSILETVADEDPVTAGLQEVCEHLTERAAGDPDLTSAVALLERRGSSLLDQARSAVDPRSEAGQRLGETYAQVFAALCVARAWIGSGPAGRQQVSPQWMAAGLVAVLSPGARMPRPTSQGLFDELMRQCRCGSRLFLGCLRHGDEVVRSGVA
jgi:alkylation response protein AidB-like acyl-CoA dehydrogenase